MISIFEENATSISLEKELIRFANIRISRAIFLHLFIVLCLHIRRGGTLTDLRRSTVNFYAAKLNKQAINQRTEHCASVNYTLMQRPTWNYRLADLDIIVKRTGFKFTRAIELVWKIVNVSSGTTALFLSILIARASTVPWEFVPARKEREKKGERERGIEKEREKYYGRVKFATQIFLPHSQSFNLRGSRTCFA